MNYKEYVIAYNLTKNYQIAKIKLPDNLLGSEIRAIISKQYGEDWKLYSLCDELKSKQTIQKEEWAACNPPRMWGP